MLVITTWKTRALTLTACQDRLLQRVAAQVTKTDRLTMLWRTL